MTNPPSRKRRVAVRATLLLAALGLAAAPLEAQVDAGGDPGAKCGDNLAPTPRSASITPAEICASIAVLAADSMEGREAGTPGADRAAAWIAGRFAEVGLEAATGGAAQGARPVPKPHLHPFAFPAKAKRDPHADRETSAAGNGPAGSDLLRTANVVGVLRGTDPRLAAEAIVVGAHYDHLGRGIAGSLAPGSDQVHNGADDNASGVAGLLELAEAFAADPPARSLVFVAFGAEELGNLGSQHWVKEPAWPLERTVAMINLDMIGRLRERLTVYGTGTSPVWPALLDSLEAAGSLALQRVPDGYGPSDHASFYGAGVPVLALFTGTHADYHKPSDDVAWIHAEGQARVLEMARAVIAALARSGRAVPYAEAPRTERRATPFRVGLGVVPDYGFAGRGLLLSSVRPGGPADQGGLQTGDVVVRLAGKDVGDVYEYTEVLAGLEADAPVEVVYLRDGEERVATVTPESR